jgi:hypothetical protein
MFLLGTVSHNTYHLCHFDYFEVMRGSSGVGDYHLKPEFSRASISSDELVLPKKLVAPSEIIEYLKFFQ